MLHIELDGKDMEYKGVERERCHMKNTTTSWALGMCDTAHLKYEPRPHALIGMSILNETLSQMVMGWIFKNLACVVIGCSHEGNSEAVGKKPCSPWTVGQQLR